MPTLLNAYAMRTKLPLSKRPKVSHERPCKNAYNTMLEELDKSQNLEIRSSWYSQPHSHIVNRLASHSLEHS